MKFLSSLIFLLIILVTLLALIFWLKPDWTLKNDGFNLYVWLRSSLFDHDLDFKNESDFYRTSFNVTEENIYSQKTSTGKTPNPFPIGSSILWAPPVIAVSILSKLERGTDFIMDGFGSLYEIAVSISSIVYGILGLFLCWLLTKEMFPKNNNQFLVYGVWLASPLLYFMIYESRMSHANAFFVNSLFIYVWYKKLGDNSYKKFIFTGLLLGLAALIRWQDIIIVAFPLAEILTKTYKKQLTTVRAFLLICTMFFSFISLFSLQMFAWKAVYGEFILVPPSNTAINPFTPHIIWFLFHPNYGAIVWHPILLIGILGLIFSLTLKNEKRIFSIPALIVLGLAIYINSSLSDWYGGGGGSFGARRIISVLPLTFIGVFYFYENLGKRIKITLIILLILLSGWNILLLPQAGKNWLWGVNPFSKLNGFKIISPPEIIKNNIKILREQLERFTN